MTQWAAVGEIGLVSQNIFTSYLMQTTTDQITADCVKTTQDCFGKVYFVYVEFE